MKRDKKYYYFLAMICFIVCYIISFILSSSNIKVGRMLATGGVLIYPVTYFISTLFSDRYGRRHSLIMITYTVFAFLFATVLIFVASLLPFYSISNTYNLTLNMMIANLAGFVVGQTLNLYIYYYLGERSGFSYLISSVIAITVDSLIFTSIAFIGVYPLKTIINIFTGQYVISVVITLFYSLCFSYLAPAMKKRKEKIDQEKALQIARESELKIKKEKDAPKKTASQKTTTTKTATKKTTTKKLTTKKETK